MKHVLNRLFGRGPWRLAPFSQIAFERTDEGTFGVHRPESFAGVLHREVAGGCIYEQSIALLGQSRHEVLLAGRPRYLHAGICPPSAKLLYTLSDAGIAGRDGVVYCPYLRTAVSETVRSWTSPSSSHKLLRAPRLHRAEYLAGISLSLATLDAEGFFHFLVEGLPRLWLARTYLPSVDYFLVSGSKQSYYCKWLKLAGVPEEKIVYMNGQSHFVCEQLLFTNRVIRDYQPDPWLIGALRGLFASTTSTRERWLWVSRSDARSRHIKWEDQILAQFPRFEKLSLSELGPGDQIAAFSGADVVAGPHGAGLANLVFAKPGIRLIEFFPDRNILPLYSRLTQVAGGRSAWATIDFHQASDLEGLASAMERFLHLPSMQV